MRHRKLFIGTALALLGALGLGYSVVTYLRSGVAEEGLVACAEGRCFLAHHIHAQLAGHVCGQPLRLSLGAGSTSGPHAHKEQNRLHWHGKLEVHPATKEIVDPTPLTLGAFFEAIGRRLSNECLDDTCNGDLCNGTPGRLRLLKNGEEQQDLAGYVWRDGDALELTFE